MLVDGMEGLVLLRHVGVDLLGVAVMGAVGRPGTVSTLTLKAVVRSSAGLVTLLVRKTAAPGTPYCQLTGVDGMPNPLASTTV